MKKIRRSALPLEYDTAAPNPSKWEGPPPTGRELGIRAASLRSKSLSELLEFARCVYEASDRWYEPWRKVGHPKSKSVEQRKAEAHWTDFLDECGWDAKRHAKVIRRMIRIGQRATILSENAANLPNSFETLAALADPIVDDADIPGIAARLTPESTTKHARQVVQSLLEIKASDELPDTPDATPTDTSTRSPEADYSGPDPAYPLVTIYLPVVDDDIVRVAAFIALSEALGFGLHELASSQYFDGRLANAIEAVRSSEELRELYVLLDAMETKERERRWSALKLQLSQSKTTLSRGRGARSKPANSPDLDVDAGNANCEPRATVAYPSLSREQDLFL